MKHTLFYCLIISVLFSACQSGKGLSSRKWNGKALDFRYLSSRSKIKYSNGEQELKAGLNVRLQKDSAVWMLIKASGIEGMRVFCRTDSVFMLDRFKKEYYAFSYKNLSDKINFSINLSIIQALLLADGPFLSLSQAETEKEGLKFQAQRNKLKRLGSLLITEIKKQNKLTLRYDQYKDVGINAFPLLINAMLTYKNGSSEIQTELQIEHQEIEEAESLSFPFIVPENYKKVEN
jgi:Domain of unknown function (DUF4292)